ncbi:hypothetical protein DMH02_008850 [Streptomyces sp. WAC 00631]|uniref:DUF6629 family protein n=1 Tax=unclassified Streptomyces TaxID=2593676 RepID=UPI000F76908A|nr:MULTISPECIES: DUF6629 family protein [unclassified Streptomyces]MCC5033323.1 hypothetical protein [Streptomyces sp. WAC 00631]MCC9741413.1 hypothetical protein [Streptomyces sp. MNU89]
MCWSATADLVAGAGICAVGVAALAGVRRRGDLPLAALPLLLGAHQIVESFLWHQGGDSGPLVLAWAVIALPLLPLWIPLGVLLAGRPGAGPAPGNGPRRAAVRIAAAPGAAVPIAAGCVTAAVLAYSLATGTVTAEVRDRTIGYAVDVPLLPLVLTGYLLATLGALLLSADPPLRLLGAVLSAGAVICAALWRTEFVSTWCAFAAVASVLMLVWVWRRAGGRAGAPLPS